jgi:hypothetical protein
MADVNNTDHGAMRIFNEGKACEAIVQCLEERANQSRTGVHWPEQERHPFPVDVAFTVGDQLFAMEHTGIEPFKGHVKLNAEADRHFNPIIDALNEYLGKNFEFQLIIPANALQGRAMAEVRTIQQAIINWFKETAFTIPFQAYRDRDSPHFSVGPAIIPGVSFAVSLNRFEQVLISSHPFDIAVAVAHGDQLRTDRIHEAIKRKFPKLAAWKRDENARTVLVLESNTISLADAALVAQDFVPLATARADRPDESFLVDSSRDPWLVWPMLIDSEPFFEFARSRDAQPSQFDPSKLVPLTKR